MKKKKNFLVYSIFFVFLLFANNYFILACTCTDDGGIVGSYATYSGGVLSDPLPAGVNGKIAYAGQTIYYTASSPCSGCGGFPDWTVTGGTVVTSTFSYPGTYAIGIQWGSGTSGTITANSYTGFGAGTLTVSINNSCSNGNISGAYTNFSSGTLSGALTYPADVNAGDVIYYKAYSKNFYGGVTFIPTNGTVISTGTSSDGYAVAGVEWGTAGAGSIIASTGAFCPTVQNITVTTPGLLFDGTDDRVTIAHASAYDLGTGNFTVEGWIKAAASQNSNATIFSNRSSTTDGLWFGLDTDGTLLAIINNGSTGTFTLNSDTDLRDDIWHHVALTRTSTKAFTTYVDGVDDGGGRTSGSNIANMTTSNPIWIGDDDGDPSNNSFTGTMKGIRFWNVGKTSDELLDYWKTNLNEYISNLIGCWDMNDNSGQTQTDVSVTAQDGTLGIDGSVQSEDPTIVPNNPAPFTINALRFDGNDERATIATSSSYDLGSGDFTIEAWVKPVVNSQTKTIASRRVPSLPSANGFSFLIDGSNLANFRITGTTLASSVALSNSWYHVAVTRSGSTLTMYVYDAATTTTSTTTRTLGIESMTPTTSVDLWIGSDEATPGLGFNGLIDEFRIWNVARSGSSISSEQNAKLISDLTQTTNLRGWWRFNAAVDQTDKDLSSIGHNSTLGTSGVDPLDPLRTADQAFSGARKGIAYNSSNSSNSDMSIESYPNPFISNVSLKAMGLYSEQAQLVVVDITGVEVYRNILSEDEPISFGESLPAGIYVVKVTDNDTVKTIKIIKNK